MALKYVSDPEKCNVTRVKNKVTEKARAQVKRVVAVAAVLKEKIPDD